MWLVACALAVRRILGSPWARFIAAIGPNAVFGSCSGRYCFAHAKASRPPAVTLSECPVKVEEYFRAGFRTRTMLSHDLLAEILALSRTLHRSGSMSPATLIKLAQHLQARDVQHSVETGAGASTLVFSHLSRSHTVFALNSDESITMVLRSPSLNRQVTTFVEGPTQKTLPAHSFRSPLQAVLLDGPHAYPFPDLEYFYLYPRIELDGLLVIDDIHIPSIQNLFQVVAHDDMFRLLEVCGKTAFLRRTDAPLFDPWGDNWWLQGFNRRTIWKYSWRDRMKSVVPESVRPLFRKYADRVRLLMHRHR